MTGIKPERAHPALAGFQHLEDLASAGWLSEALFAALDLELFARLGHEERSAAELAQAQGWDAAALQRLLAALAGLGLLAEREGRYANGPAALKHLLPDSPEYLGDFLAYRRYIAGHWKRLPARVRRGPAANQRDGDEPPEDYRERVRAYVRALDAQARLKASEAMERLALLMESPRRVLDLGGGAGAWCRAALRHWPRCQATLLDLPEVIAAAQSIYPEPVAWAGIQAVPGDCRAPTTAGGAYDLVILSNLLHAYGQEEARGIVARAARLLAPGGSLLIHDYLGEEQGGAAIKGALYDLHMLVNTYNGRIHSLESLADMLSSAGLGDWRLLPLPSDSALILARAGEGGGAACREELLIMRALRLGFARAKVIPAGEVKVEEWVAQKCATGCANYGRGLQCPPHSPTPERTRAILAAYHRALLVQGEPPGEEFHDQLLALERHCFLAGSPQALALGAGPCRICERCDVSRPCRFPDRARPAMEACGIDVYGTVAQAGWQLEPVREPGGYVQYIGLILVD